MREYRYGGKSWKYIPAQGAGAEAISHDKVVGDVFVRRSQNPISHLTAERTDGTTEDTPVYPYKEKLGLCEKTVGFVPDSGETGRYARIVKKSTAKLLAPLVLVLVLVAALLVYFRPWAQNGPNLDQSAIAYQMPNGVKNEDPSRIMMPFFDEITMTNAGQGKVALVNPDGNTCYFKYILTLDDGNKTVYESGLIQPGMAVTEWYLDDRLEAGEYDATLKIETSDLEDYTQAANGANYVVKLIVEE